MDNDSPYSGLSSAVAEAVWPFAANDAGWGVLGEIKDLATDMGLERYSDRTVVLAIRDVFEKKEGEQ